MEAAPTLSTARLRLRAHRRDDFDACYAMWSDPAVTRFIGGKPSSRQQTWMRLLTYMGHWSAMGYGYWVIEEQSTGLYAGEIGFADFKREIAPVMQNVPEVGFAVVSRLHGNGYCTEALAAVQTWGDAHLPSNRTVALTDQANLASQRILEKAGYACIERAAFNGTPTLFFERVTAKG